MTTKFFSGSALNGVDGKNRLSVPAPFREAAEARSATRAIIVGPHARHPCLTGYDQSRFATLTTEAAERFGDDFDAREDYLAETFGSVEELPYDDTGRIILPQGLKEIAGIDRLAFFVGASDHFQLWDPQAFLAARGDSLVGRRLAQLMKARAA